MGLSGRVGPECGFPPTSVAVEGGVFLNFFGSFLRVLSSVGKEEGTFVVFPFSFRVLIFFSGGDLAQLQAFQVCFGG